MRILSLGGGTQSSALLLMSCDGVLPKLDAAIFADTQHEMPETYAYLDFLAMKAKAAGIEYRRVTAGDLKAELIGRQGRGMQPNLPVRVRDPETGDLERINAYRCSFDFKRRVVTREVKRLCGGRGAWKRATVAQWIGYSVDEQSRMKRSEGCRCGHNRTRILTAAERRERADGAKVELIHSIASGCSRCDCAEFSPWQVNAWPLIDPLRMTRRDVERWIADQGYPVPTRSACYFCPNRGNGHWRELYARRDVCADCGHSRDDHWRGFTEPLRCAHLYNPGDDSAPADLCACLAFRSLWDSAVEVDEFVRHGMNEMRGEGYLHQSGVPLAQADLRPKYEQLRDQGIEPLFVDEIDTDCDAGTCFT